MAIEPIEIKDTVLKIFSPTLDFACQEQVGGAGSSGKTTGQSMIDFIGSLNLSNLTDASQARVNIGLGNVDNTSDLNKPISTATQTALNLKANANAVLLSINGDTTQNQVIAGGNGTLVSTGSGITAIEVDSSVTQQANIFNGNNQLVQTDAGGKIPLSVLPTSSANTPNTVVLRDVSGSFSANTITASLNGNASTATFAAVSGNSTNFTGSLSGDVTGAQTSTTVLLVGGQSAVLIASGATLANAATSLNTNGAIVRRDGSGNFSANIITASLNGNAATATNATQASLALSVATGSVTNAGLATMAANTAKANITAGSAPPTDVALASFKAWLGNTLAGANAVGNFSLSGTFTSGSGIFTALGSKAVTLTGSTPSIGIGANAELGEATGGGNFATNAITGDAILRTISGKTLRLLAGSGTSVLDITSNLANLNFPLTLPQTQGGALVSGSATTNIEYYQDFTHTTNMAGAVAISGYVCYIKRENTLVTLTLPAWSSTATANSAEAFSSALPLIFRPVATQKIPSVGLRGAAQRTQNIQITSAGVVTFFGDETATGNYNSGQAASSGGGTFTYSVI